MANPYKPLLGHRLVQEPVMDDEDEIDEDGTRNITDGIKGFIPLDVDFRWHDDEQLRPLDKVAPRWRDGKITSQDVQLMMPILREVYKKFFGRDGTDEEVWNHFDHHIMPRINKGWQTPYD